MTNADVAQFQMAPKQASCAQKYDPLPGLPLKLIVGNEFAERFGFGFIS